MIVYCFIKKYHMKLLHLNNDFEKTMCLIKIHHNWKLTIFKINEIFEI